MARCLYIVFFLSVTFYDGVSQIANNSQSIENQRYLHIAHTRTSSNPRMDEVVESLDYSNYDMLWLGGDLAWSTSMDEMTMMHVDSIFNLGEENTLLALGNHDYADLERIQAYTSRPAYYAYHRNGVTFLVLDTQDSVSNIIAQQRRLFYNVADTISESSHLIILHHKLIWMYGDPYLQPQIQYISNAGLGDSACFSCIHPNNFYSEIYPELLEVEENGVEVICIAGDIGFRTNQFEYMTPEGIQYLASGIESGKPSNMALLFHHDLSKDELSWEYVLLSELLNPVDDLAPVLHSISISPDSILGGDSIRITIETEDPGSGLDEITLDIVNPYGEQIHTISNHIDNWTSLGEQVYTFDMLIADSAVAGSWDLSSLSIADSAGNVLILDNKDSILASFIVYDPLGLDLNEFLLLTLFPVPGSGIFHITNNPGIASVNVLDQTGRALKIIRSITNSIDLTEFPDGIYFLHIRMSDNQFIMRKVIISK